MNVWTLEDYVKVYKEHGSIKAVSRNTSLTYHGSRKLFWLAVEDKLIPDPKNKPVMEGQVKVTKIPSMPIPEEGEVKRYLFTSAQNNTKVHKAFFDNLEAFAEFHDAEIHVARITYVKSGLGAKGDKATIDEAPSGKKQPMWWDERIDPYLSDNKFQVAPGLIWCGEWNILPTAVRPLSQLESHNGSQSGIYPHSKRAIESVATNHVGYTKFNYTTGTVTMRNYIQRKAGLKSELFHCYGALLVEVDSNGNWYCREINATDDGSFYDLDMFVKDGKYSFGHRVEAITWGDIHVAEIDLPTVQLCWGDGGMAHTLRPKYQFLHDVLDFRCKSHHEIKNPHMMFKRHTQGWVNVEEEVRLTAEFVNRVYNCKDDSQIIIVDSNHHNHLGRWLREQEGLKDPTNAIFWLELNAKILREMQIEKEPIILKEAFKLVGFDFLDIHRVKFLGEDESFVICGDIEGGMHGDIGPNGARGSPAAFAKMGKKANTGHTHKAQVIDGVYVCGTTGKLNPDWTSGPSSWSHTETVTYQNGMRTLVTLFNGKWRA